MEDKNILEEIDFRAEQYRNDERAVQIVREYIEQHHYEQAKNYSGFSVAISWRRKDYISWEYRLTSTLHDKRFYHLIYDKKDNVWWLSVCEELESMKIKD